MSSEYIINEETFLKEVAEHKLHIIRDDGVNRHLSFHAPNSYIMGFDLITWPGALCYTGDMGTYVFERTTDMFELFRDSGEGVLRINLRYWAEKVEAACRNGVTEYSADKFREDIARRLDNMEADEETRELVAEKVLPIADEGEVRARDAANEAEINGEQIFDGFYEDDLHVYTHRFRWCCYAMVWAIREYDQYKTNQEKAAA